MKQKMFGFSLIELMITLAIFGILVAIVTPSFSRLVAGNAISSVRDSLMSSLNFAKTEAIRLNTNIGVCPSSNGTSCLNSEDWSQGWIVYQDTGTGNTSTVGTVLRVVGDTNGINVIHTGERTGLTPTVFIRYLPQGFAQDSAPMPAQVIAFCDANGDAEGRAISFGATTGQIRPGDKTVANCP